MTLLSLRIDLFFTSNENAHLNLLRYMIIFMGMISTIIALVFEKKIKNVCIYHFAIRYISITLIIVLFFIIYTKQLYGYSLYQTFSLATAYLYHPAAIGIIYILNHEKKPGTFLNTILKISFFFICIKFLAWLTYNFFPFHLFENFAIEYSNWTRNGLQRVNGGSLFGITYILANAKAMMAKETVKPIIKTDRKYYWIIIFLFIYNCIVIQSRYMGIVLLITSTITYYATRKKNISKLMMIALIGVGACLLLIIGILPDLYNSFSLSGKYGSSTLARIDGLQHFYELFKTMGKGIGLGFVANGYGTEYLFYRTSWLNYYISDLGIIGSFFRFGLCTFLLYAYLFIKMIRTTILCKRKQSYLYPIMLTTSIYAILTCLASELYDSSCAFAMPFYVAITSYISGKCKTDKTISKNKTNIRKIK